MSNAQTSLSDESLMQRCLAVPRDRAAWDELYRRYESPMLAAAHNALGALARNKAETDQAVLDVWEYLWGASRPFREVGLRTGATSPVSMQ